jgi:hypothetical protein
VLVHLKAFFGQRKLRDFTFWHLEQYKKTRKEAEMVPATVNLELGILKAIPIEATVFSKDITYIDANPKGHLPVKG